MKKFVLSVLMAVIFTGVVAQSVKTEYKYLSLINRQQNTQLIKDNLRNAELIADTLFYQLNKTSQQTVDTVAALFFKELAMSYFLSGRYPEAMFSFLRQRFLYPVKQLDPFSVYYFTQAAAFEDISKEMVDFQLEKSSLQQVSGWSLKEREEALLINSILLNKPELNSILMHYTDMIKVLQDSVPEFVDKWAFLVQIGIRQNLMRGYVNYYQGDMDTLSFEMSKIFYRKATHYYLKNKGWNMATHYNKKYDALPLKFNHKITSAWFKLRRNLHL